MTSEDFQKACKLGDVNLIETAIKACPNSINELDPKLGWAPLYRSIVYGIEETSEALLSLGANPNIQNRLGQTPLHQASETNNVKLARLLLAHKANPNIQQNDGDTPLHLACYKGSNEMVEVLLNAGADPNVVNFVLGRTPLHCACEKGIYTLVKSLLESNALIYCKDKNGLLPADLATDSQISKLIEEKACGKSCKTVVNEEETGSKESIYEPESEKALLSTSRLKLGATFSFGETMKSPLYSWLLTHKLENIHETLQTNGFDDLDLLIESMKSTTPLSQSILKQIGIEKLGHRLRFLSKLEEQCVLTSRYSINQDNKFFWCVSTSSNPKSNLNLNDWLASLHLEYLYKNFLNCGFDDMDQIMCVMNSSFPITDEMLENDIGISKIGHRHRILSKLNNDRNPGYYRNVVRFDKAEKVTACESCYIM
ncbi:hypothetical protein SteCoe_10271 [Stentor coeruleus]|uniref:SAM domain-containing protein n=1 Tax=Stentor coeruleus TaxID=5963 RepID=A0A1R2CFZ4_9CILI|nr:hypothetical protein SteCoe_10271 [Stentor coeruleus]